MSNSETDFDEELKKVENDLEQVKRAVQKLLSKQQKLENRRDELMQLIQQSSSAALASLDWERIDHSWSSKVRDVLLNIFKLKTFRPYQLATINIVMSGHDCILLMPTGGGKSLCYQLPAMILSGITLVVSPLVSLMEDQIMALEALDVPAAMLNASSSKEHVNNVQNSMITKGDSLKLLYVTPEKLAKSKRFMAKLQKMFQMGRFSLLAIDEVHCCSQWGHDFRPDYKFLGIMKRQFPSVPILGLTATATAKVINDVQKILDIQGSIVLKASFNRPNLKYEVCTSSQKENINDLENLLKHRFKGLSGIIYCFSIKESEEISSELHKRGIRAKSYHAQLDAKVRSFVHRAWINNEVQVVVATIAFGMGIDKPDVRFVIHHSISKSMENFYQESGRAGRDDKLAHCILFYRFSDMFRQSTMVFTEQTGLENLYAMIAYCLDNSRCRRAIIAQHFGERWNASDCKKMCDNCEASNPNVEERDVTSKCLQLYTILEHCSLKDERLTALKLIESWMGKGPPKLRPPGKVETSLSKETCEYFIALLLLEGYLKEEFHFTPYSTISYINHGPKANAVIKGNLKVVLPIKCSKKKSVAPKNDIKSPVKEVPSAKKQKADKKEKPKICVINNAKSHFIDKVIAIPSSDNAKISPSIQPKSDIKSPVKEVPSAKKKKADKKEKPKICVINNAKSHFIDKTIAIPSSDNVKISPSQNEVLEACSTTITKTVEKLRPSEVISISDDDNSLDFKEWDRLKRKRKISSDDEVQCVSDTINNDEIKFEQKVLSSSTVQCIDDSSCSN